MWDFLGKLAIVIGIISGVIALASFLPMVAPVLNSVVSPELQQLAVRIFALFALVVCLLRQFVQEKRLRKLEGGKEPYVSLEPDEIIHPSPNGVLWKWKAEIGADGPFCPRHRGRLFYKNFVGTVKPENFDEDLLSNSGWFVCPIDKEEFKFFGEGLTWVRELKSQAAARLRDR